MKLLFVCLGNICRSPAAEAIMTKLLKEAGLEDHVSCDSCGTAGYHSGEPADERMICTAASRGIEITSLSRKLYPDQDFQLFDKIFAMDQSNFNDIQSLANEGELVGKLEMMTDYHPTEDHVPDPYFGGEQGFHQVLDILEECCKNYLAKEESVLNLNKP